MSFTLRRVPSVPAYSSYNESVNKSNEEIYSDKITIPVEKTGMIRRELDATAPERNEIIALLEKHGQPMQRKEIVSRT